MSTSKISYNFKKAGKTSAEKSNKSSKELHQERAARNTSAKVLKQNAKKLANRDKSKLQGIINPHLNTIDQIDLNDFRGLNATLTAHDILKSNNRKGQQIPPPSTSVNTVESVIQNSSTPIRTVQYLLIGHLEIIMCNNYHDSLFTTLAYILEVAGLMQYVEMATLIQVAQKADTLFTNLTPNSKHAYLSIPIKHGTVIETRNLYTTISTTAGNRFGYKTDATGKPTKRTNKVPAGLSANNIDHTVALMTTPISEQSKVFLTGRNFTSSLANFVCLRILSLVLPLSTAAISFTVLYHLFENQIKPDDKNRIDPLGSTEPCVIVLVPLTTSPAEMESLRTAFMVANPQDFFWEDISTQIRTSETMIRGLKLELTTSLANFHGRRFLNIYSYNLIEFTGLAPDLDDIIAFQAFIRVVPIAHIVCIIRACFISETEGHYYIFLNTDALTSVNIDSLRELKAPNVPITRDYRNVLVGGLTGSKFSIPNQRTREIPQTPTQPSVHQVQPVASQQVETNEQSQVHMIKTLLGEVKSLRAELRQLHDKVDRIEGLIIQRDVPPSSSRPTTPTVLSNEQISPPRKIRDTNQTATLNQSADMVI